MTMLERVEGEVEERRRDRGGPREEGHPGKGGVGGEGEGRKEKKVSSEEAQVDSKFWLREELVFGQFFQLRRYGGLYPLRIENSPGQILPCSMVLDRGEGREEWTS